ncbi:Type I restriction modification DNA specificity domain [Megamonas hypermegale]|uniref:Type I restriction modification DNA specificity domain n=1 Tax=Megamonas hypermegale TaxID=158847 RepID=A0A378PTE6_9FIRM|nr:restriction endonuclease subunit S [Megamonas hypermegale]STY91775.1 Type I restriction modification DNA specificity domain [Megamonas hypermegale]
MNKSITLSQITTSIFDGKHGDCENLKGSGLYFISVKDLSDYNINYYNAREITPNDFEQNYKRTNLEEGDTIYANTGDTIGKSIFVKNNKLVSKTSFQKSIAVLKPNINIIEPRYLYYLMKYETPRLRKVATGSGQKNLLLSTMRDFKVTIHDRKRQKQICSLLGLLDDKIEINNKINDELENMAKTIYDYWFLQFEFPNEEGKPYKSSGGKMVWNEELKREIPEGWDLCTIEDISICHDAKRIPLSNKEREQMKGDIPYYGATGIMDYVNQYIFDGDYVLIAEDGSIMNDDGSPILQRISGKTWVNNHAHILEPIDNYSCKLLMMILKDIPVVTIKTGSIQMKINQKNLNKVKIVSVPNNLKNRINRILNDIDKKILLNKKENQELTSLRDFLLPLLMNGQVGFKEDKAEG